MDNGNEIAVRRKSSYRKQRSEAPPRAQRAPSQERSKQRRETLLQAAEQLLETACVEDLSHSEIAGKANVARASVHYHFPNIASLQYELGRRYDAQLTGVMQKLRDSFTSRPIATWHEWIRIEAEAARDWFNANRPACEALLGPLLTRENRVAGMQDNARAGKSKLENLSRLFEVPGEEMLALTFTYNVEMTDLLWSASYQRKGFIDDDALEESIRASIGYLRSFLPDILPRKVHDVKAVSHSQA